MKIRKILVSLIFGAMLLSASIFALCTQIQSKTNMIDAVDEFVEDVPQYNEGGNVSDTWTITFDENVADEDNSKFCPEATLKEWVYETGEYTLNLPGFSSYNESTDNYVFLGWYTASDGGSRLGGIGDSIVVNFSCDETIYAQWMPRYTIQADAQGGIIDYSNSWEPVDEDSINTSRAEKQCSSETYTYEVSAGAGYFDKLPTVTREGYTLLGWSFDTAGESGFLSDGFYAWPEKAIYAVWEANEYTINFDGNGGTGSIASESFTFDNDKNLPTNSFMRDGYKFICWQADNIDGQNQNIQPILTLSKIIVLLGFEYQDATITLKVKWSDEAFNVNVYVQDTSGEYEYLGVRNVEREIDKSVATIASELGYVVEGGIEYSYSNNVDTSEEITTIDATVTDVDMYFTRVMHTATINPKNGTWNGSSNTSTISGYYQQQCNLDNAVRPGYTFGGWRQTSGNAITGGGTITFKTTDVVLEAIWTGTSISGTINTIAETTDEVVGNEYTIIYDENGGKEISDSFYNTRESEQTITLANAYRNGYSFKGWEIVSGSNTSSVGSTIGDDNLSLIIPANDYGDIQLKAIWEIANYSITFENNEGSADITAYNMKESSDQTINLTPTTKDGYIFTGWSLNKNSSEATINNSTNVLTIKAGTFGDIVVTAVWTSKTYTISWVWNQGLDSSAMLTNPIMWNYAGKAGYTSTNPGSRYLYTISESSVSSNVAYNTMLDYYTPIPMIAGYTFAGWLTSLEESGVMVADAYGNWVASVEGYTDSYKKWLNDDADGKVELYAQYTPTEYAIAYDYVGGTASNPATYSVNNSQTIATPTKTGHEFAGWEATLVLNKQNKATISSSGEGEQSYIEETADAVLYDLFYIKSGITYSGTIIDDSITWMQYTGTSATSISNDKTIEGTGIYVLNYYPKGNVDEVVYVNLQIPGGFSTGAYNFMGKLLLKATWTINQYKLTINPNGGRWNNSTTNSEVVANYGTELKIANPTRLGYKFDGWAYSGDGVWYEDLSTFIYTDNGTLQAIWRAVSPTISISAIPNDDKTQTTITYGQSISFTAVAKHDLGITYQWHISNAQGFTPSEVSNTQISGAVNSTYTYQSITIGTYYFKCVATANGLSTTSNEIKVIINKAENIFDVNIKYGLVCNKTPQVLLEATDINDVENDVYYKVYKFDNNEIGDEVAQTDVLPMATDAGMYIVYFSVAETDYYLGLTGSAVVEIEEQPYTDLIIDPNNGMWNNTTEQSTFTNPTGHEQDIEDPERSGYNFTGWVITGGGTFDKTNKIFTYGLTDTTLTATWDAIIYTIIINENGGEEVDDLEYITGETEKTLPTLTRAGYDFTEWVFVKSSTPAATLNGNTLIINENTIGEMEIRAEWTGLTNNITYDVNNGSWKHDFEPSQNQTQYITSENVQTISLPTSDNISRDGYTFAGWDYNGATINDTLTINANSYGEIKLIAVWNGNTYKITYNTNGGAFISGYNSPTQSYTTQEVKDYDLKTLPTSSYITRKGYAFTGWSIEENSMPEQSEIIGNEIKIPKNNYGDIVLTATWAGELNNISYNTNGGTWNSGYTATPTQYLTSESEQTFSLPTSDNIEREGHTFAGWKITANTMYATCTITGSDNTTLVIPANAYVTTGSYLTLQAQWTINQYTLTINYNYSGKENETITQDYDSTYTLENPERDGYEFVNWALTGAGTYTDGVYTFGSANGTLTANWKVNQYRLTINPNGGKWANGTQEASEETQYISQDYGTSVQINLPVRVGHEFNSWVLTGGGTFEQNTYTFGTEDGVLTAQWDINTYKLTVDLNYDGDNDIESDVDNVIIYTENYGTTNEYDSPKRRGYTLVEWIFEGDGVFTQLEDDGYKYQFLGDGLVRAVWEEDEYLLELDFNGGTISHLGKTLSDQMDYTFDIVDNLSGDFEHDYTKAYINLEEGKGFNGDRSLYIRIEEAGENSYSHRLKYPLFRDNGGLPIGKYQLDLYVKTNKSTNGFEVCFETYYEETYSEIYKSSSYNLSGNVWYHIQEEISIYDTKSSLTNIMFYLDVGTAYQLDEIKFVRLTDEYGNYYDVQSEESITKIKYLYTQPQSMMPYAVKAGYTFLGWNEDLNATESTTTGWATYYGADSLDPSIPVRGDKKYYAIYKLSNPTVSVTTPKILTDNDDKKEYDISSEEHEIVYNKSSATLTANVNTEGLNVNKINYQWHVSTTSNFTPDEYTAISGANSITYTHQKTAKSVGTYYYACVVSIQKDSEVSASIASDYTIVNVVQGDPEATISMDDYVYSNTPSEPQCSNNISEGQLTYYYNTIESSTGGTKWENITSTTLNAGTYYMYATIEETENFKAGVSNIVEFKVNSKELTKPTITGNYVYNRTELAATINNLDTTKMAIVDGSVTKATDAGTYTITIALLDKTNYNYSWQDDVANTYGTIQDLELTWTIAPYDLTNVTIEDVPDQRYTTLEVEPKPTITATELNNYVLVEDEEFEFSYTDNIQQGTATLTITGKGNYTGTQSATFEIVGELINKPTITSTYKYNATEQTVNIDGFNENTMTIAEGSVIKATNAGTYSVEIALKEFYTWSDLSIENITLTWIIEKADVTLTPEQSSVSIRVGETREIVINVETSYGGSINGEQLDHAANPPSIEILTGIITNNTSTVSIKAVATHNAPEKAVIKYCGDGNHNTSNVTINVEIITLYVNLVINGSGNAKINNARSSSEQIIVDMNAGITFTATPSENYGLIKYSIQNNISYIGKTASRKLTDSFTSDTITVSDTLLGNTNNSVANKIILIELWFDAVVSVNLNTDLTQTGATSHEISTIYEEENVNFEFDETNKTLKAFESATLNVNVTANKIGDQYYIINKITVGDQTEGRKELNTNITAKVEDLTTNSRIEAQAVKVFNAEDKEVNDISARIGTIKVETDALYEFEIENKKYVIENSPVNIQITTTDKNYDFLAIKVNGIVMLKGQLEGAWEHNGSVSTWKTQQYTKQLSEMEAIILEKWYTAGVIGRTVKVQVADGIDAKLVNTDIGYSYTLANNIFDVSSEGSLYVGNWMVHIDSATITNYKVEVSVDGEVYGKDEIFNIETTTKNVNIKITAL